jgi:pre-mRNA-splicing factor ATP-dependent RNA helicase DHX15/PRP43
VVCPSEPYSALRGAESKCRLLDYGTNYFDPSSFQDGETKRALQTVVKKRAGKATGRVDETNGESRKKRKKQ